ncbi:MAG: type IV pilus modification protein PilV [Nitrospira sp.]|nr:type IV pilus modification protein PilV [Nitrospira sp.]
MKSGDDKGFTLVEVLVSAAILGVGVMGMAAMQGVSFSKNVDANDLSIVTNVAADMMERIQNNRRYAWAYNNLDTTGVGNCLAGGMPAPPPLGVPPITKLQVTQTVQGDCTQWRARILGTNLVNAVGLVTSNPVAPAGSGAMQVTVRLNWNDRGPGQRARTVAFQTLIVPE